MKTLLIVLLAFSGTSALLRSEGKAFWTCSSGKCVRSFVNDTQRWLRSNEYQSVQLCRLSCGVYGALWPKPTFSVSLSQTTIPFHYSSITYTINSNEPDLIEFLQEAIDIFKINVRTECGKNCSIRTDYSVSINIDVTLPDLSLNWQTDEGYNLDVLTNSNVVITQITANTYYGARHALETLNQLIASYSINDDDLGIQRGLVVIQQASIQDRPAYAHRGLLIDTARNFLPVKAIERQLDAMAASKLNVLHWHATDSQSFPIQSTRVPELSRYGAYSPEKIYTSTDIRNLVRYARIRGVRIILEIDAPSHAGNGWQWGESVGLGSLAVCINRQPWRSYCVQPPCGQLNPANDNVYKVLGKLYKDVTEMFPKEVLHMGGDEVAIGCWNATDEIIQYMSDRGWGRTETDFLNLWSEFQSRALASFDAQTNPDQLPTILWTSGLTEPDIIENYLDKDRYIIQTWVPAASTIPAELLEKGYRLIVSTKDAWYLDHGFWGSTQYHSWKTVYANKIPRNNLVLGGEVCMWGEYVDDSSVDMKIWPRAAAAAERLWSDPDGSEQTMEARFLLHRQRLVKRGIDSDAVTPRWCYLNDGECS